MQSLCDRKHLTQGTKLDRLRLTGGEKRKLEKIHAGCHIVSQELIIRENIVCDLFDWSFPLDVKLFVRTVSRFRLKLCLVLFVFKK